jgi:hypothetical protein
MNGKWTAISRQWVVIRKIIDDFLNPDSIFRRLFAAGQESADVGVASCINIDAECRNRLLGNGFDRLVGLFLVAFGICIIYSGIADVGHTCRFSRYERFTVSKTIAVKMARVLP